jgi:hypothetical protein
LSIDNPVLEEDPPLPQSKESFFKTNPLRWVNGA